MLPSSPLRLLLFLPFLMLASCKHEPQVVPSTEDAGYPAPIARLLRDRCQSCHNEQNAANSAGLRTDTWDQLFHGARNGAVVVPYDIENSSLLYFINTDHTLGQVSKPTMPSDGTPLSRDEYIRVRDWIAAGAPNAQGEVAFASNADTRQKIYTVMQGCDLLGVVDAGRSVVMRYIRIGMDPSKIEVGHCVRVSPDGRYAYVSFLKSDWVQKIDTRTDEVVAKVNLGASYPGAAGGSWNVLTLSQDGQRFAVSNWIADGALVVVNTANMAVEQAYYGSELLINPHGIAATPNFDTFFITAEQGNTVYKLSPNGGLYEKISIDNAPSNFQQGTRDPHEIIFAPDYSKYFVTCQSSNEVRVMNPRTNAVIKAIATGARPKEMAVSNSLPYLFVTCEEDPRTDGYRGSVHVINYNTLDVVAVIKGAFFQPHGITVDDLAGTFYVSSRNASTDGLESHHTSSCGVGRNGWYSVYSLSTLQPATTRRFEVSVDPYSMDTRFK